ncbi:MAG: nucleotidyltransferase family protein [Desulfuromonadaceae bacterium]
MKTVGLITEYNPFHNGHLHHLQASLRETGADISVAVMSGRFLQRGEPALVVDLVVELPFPWACNSAPRFAHGAIQALEALGGIDSLCFGSETGDLTPLQQIAKRLIEQEPTLDRNCAHMLRQGLNYPRARARCLAETPELDETLIIQPNNILGIEYLKALRQQSSAIVPHTIQRIGAGYHEEQARDHIASATGLRRMLREGEAISAYIPTAALPPLEQALAAENQLDYGKLHPLLAALILRQPENLRSLYQVENGIEQRLFEAALASTDYASLVAAGKVRHLTLTRLQRILCYILNQVERDEMEAFLAAGPLYLHLLGSSERGRTYLATSRKQRSCPLVANYSRIQSQLKRHYGPGSRQLQLAERMLQLELRATRNYTLLLKRWSGNNRNRDFFQALVI